MSASRPPLSDSLLQLTLCFLPYSLDQGHNDCDCPISYNDRQVCLPRSERRAASRSVQGGEKVDYFPYSKHSVLHFCINLSRESQQDLLPVEKNKPFTRRGGFPQLGSLRSPNLKTVSFPLGDSDWGQFIPRTAEGGKDSLFWTFVSKIQAAISYELQRNQSGQDQCALETACQESVTPLWTSLFSGQSVHLSLNDETHLSKLRMTAFLLHKRVPRTERD